MTDPKQILPARVTMPENIRQKASSLGHSAGLIGRSVGHVWATTKDVQDASQRCLDVARDALILHDQLSKFTTVPEAPKYEIISGGKS